LRDFYYYEPGQGHGLADDPLKAVIEAKPKGWVFSLSGKGDSDLTLYHFFDTFSGSPLVMGFFGGESRDSIRNIAETREFSWNLADQTSVAAVSLITAPASVVASELAKAALTPVRSRKISAHRIAESAVSLECHLMRLVRLQDITGRASETWLILSEVIAVHVDTLLIKSGTNDTAIAKGYVGKEGGISHDGRSDT
jgi:flavin reductase (DIM6/NTAB) family NADH-FMN oxidoreductase RutF